MFCPSLYLYITWNRLCYGYSRTIASITNVFRWLYPTLNKVYLILSYLIYISVKNYEKYLQVRPTSNFRVLQPVHMFIESSLKIKLHSLSTALLSGFQSALGWRWISIKSHWSHCTWLEFCAGNPSLCGIVVQMTQVCGDFAVLLLEILIYIQSTVRCRYNAIIFLPNPLNRRPIAHPKGEVLSVFCGFEIWFMSSYCLCIDK